jgi:hypothetical protein
MIEMWCLSVNMFHIQKLYIGIYIYGIEILHQNFWAGFFWFVLVQCNPSRFSKITHYKKRMHGTKHSSLRFTTFIPNNFQYGELFN